MEWPPFDIANSIKTAFKFHMRKADLLWENGHDVEVWIRLILKIEFIVCVHLLTFYEASVTWGFLEIFLPLKTGRTPDHFRSSCLFLSLQKVICTEDSGIYRGSLQKIPSSCQEQICPGIKCRAQQRIGQPISIPPDTQQQAGQHVFVLPGLPDMRYQRNACSLDPEISWLLFRSGLSAILAVHLAAVRHGIAKFLPIRLADFQQPGVPGVADIFQKTKHRQSLRSVMISIRNLSSDWTYNTLV